MASIINALSSGTGGIITAGDASGILQLQTANTAAVTIDGSQNVGIGTASPAGLLHVAGAIRTSSGSNYAQFSNNFLRSNASGTFYYDNATVGQSNEFRTSVSSSLDTTALTLTASGILALRNAATNATGIGITFPATQSASSDANTLDDYEEGTWTPSLGGNTTYNYQSGTYVKVGRLVHAQFYIDINVIGTGSTGIISGLPFASANLTPGQAPGLSIGYFTGLNSTVYFLAGYKNNGDATIIMTGTTAGATNITNAINIFKNSTSLYAAVTYQTS